MIRDLIVPIGDRSISSKHFVDYSRKLLSNMDIVFIDMNHLDENVTGYNSQLENDTIVDSEVILPETKTIPMSNITTSLMNKSSPAGKKRKIRIFFS